MFLMMDARLCRNLDLSSRFCSRVVRQRQETTAPASSSSSCACASLTAVDLVMTGAASAGDGITTTLPSSAADRLSAAAAAPHRWPSDRASLQRNKVAMSAPSKIFCCRLHEPL